MFMSAVPVGGGERLFLLKGRAAATEEESGRRAGWLGLRISSTTDQLGDCGQATFLLGPRLSGVVSMRAGRTVYEVRGFEPGSQGSSVNDGCCRSSGGMRSSPAAPPGLLHSPAPRSLGACHASDHSVRRQSGFQRLGLKPLIQHLGQHTAGGGRAQRPGAGGENTSPRGPA